MIVIFASARSASTTLLKMIGNLNYEPFMPFKLSTSSVSTRSPSFKEIDTVLDRISKSNQIGFKHIDTQMSVKCNLYLIEQLYNKYNAKIIFIYRKNEKGRLLSEIVARYSKQWHNQTVFKTVPAISQDYFNFHLSMHNKLTILYYSYIYLLFEEIDFFKKKTFFFQKVKLSLSNNFITNPIDSEQNPSPTNFFLMFTEKMNDELYLQKLEIFLENIKLNKTYLSNKSNYPTNKKLCLIENINSFYPNLTPISYKEKFKTNKNLKDYNKFIKLENKYLKKFK